jgi:hypothetical protein
MAITGVDNFKIQLGLSPLPSDTVPPELYDDFFTVHRALQNLLRGVSQYCGIDAPSSDTWAQLPYSETQLSGNLTRLYPIATVAIARGQVVNLFNNAGTVGARLAIATGLANMGHGVANSAAAIGEPVELNTFTGLLDSIGGLLPGTIYYLSPSVAGTVQNAPPGAAGQIVQPIGIALNASTMIMNIPLNPRIV